MVLIVFLSTLFGFSDSVTECFGPHLHRIVLLSACEGIT